MKLNTKQIISFALILSLGIGIGSGLNSTNTLANNNLASIGKIVYTNPETGQDEIVIDPSDHETLQSNIDKNTSAIHNNQSAIQSNTSAIQDNKTNIESNSSAIANAKLDIDKLEESIGNLPDNSSAISSNTDKINTNTSNINKNTTAIANNSSAISSNTSKINQNTTKINENTESIESIQNSINNLPDNSLAIESNTSKINENTSKINENTSKINENTLNISNNSTKLNQNTENIATNSSNIDKNTTAISRNTNDIAELSNQIASLPSIDTSGISTNAANINKNTTAISNNLSKINTNTAKIDANTQSINTNKTNIANNTTKISTNTTNIANNTANIEQLQDQLGNLDWQVESTTSITLDGITYDNITVDVVYVRLPSHDNRYMDLGYIVSSNSTKVWAHTGQLITRYFIEDSISYSDWVSVNTSSSIVNTLDSNLTTQSLSANQGRVLNEKFNNYYTKDEINTSLNNYLLKNSVVNNLTSTSTTSPLSAAQGKILKDQLNGFKYTAETVNSITINGVKYNNTVDTVYITLPSYNGRKVDIGYVVSVTLSDTSLTGRLMYRYYIDDVFKSDWYTIITREDVVNNLGNTSTTLPLSAAQGKLLNDTKVNWKSENFTNYELVDIVKYITQCPGMCYIGRFVLPSNLSPTNNNAWLKGFAIAQNNVGSQYPVNIMILALTDDNSGYYIGRITGTTSYSISWQKITTSSDIVNNLTNTSTTAPLSANQGKVLNDKVNKVNIYVGSDGKLHFINASGVDTALNFSKGSGEAFDFIEKYGYGRTDKVTGFNNGYVINLGETITLSAPSTADKYGYGEGYANNAIQQGNYTGNITGFQFDKCLSYVGGTFNNGVVKHTITGIKRGTTIFSIPLKFGEQWYVRYVVVTVV